MSGRISNEDELLPFLDQASAWKWLFGYEVGAIRTEVAASQLGIEREEFFWLRALALTHVRQAGAI